VTFVRLYTILSTCYHSIRHLCRSSKRSFKAGIRVSALLFFRESIHSPCAVSHASFSYDIAIPPSPSITTFVSQSHSPQVTAPSRSRSIPKLRHARYLDDNARFIHTLLYTLHSLPIPLFCYPNTERTNKLTSQNHTTIILLSTITFHPPSYTP
jgi:hypothetical protein